jgi:predicted ribosome quality control (RQC) complex YloA/Tae2 family protein
MKISNKSRQDTATLRQLAREVYREIRKTEGNPKRIKWAEFRVHFCDKARAKYTYVNARCCEISMPLKVRRVNVARAIYYVILRKAYGVRTARENYHRYDLSFVERPNELVTAEKKKEPKGSRRDTNHDKAIISVARARVTVQERAADIVRAEKALVRAEKFLKKQEQKVKRYERAAEKREVAEAAALTDHDFAARMRKRRGG